MTQQGLPAVICQARRDSLDGRPVYAIRTHEGDPNSIYLSDMAERKLSPYKLTADPKIRVMRRLRKLEGLALRNGDTMILNQVRGLMEGFQRGEYTIDDTTAMLAIFEVIYKEGW